jgi:hypothetical protein
MANVTFIGPITFQAGRWEPGATQGIFVGPADAFKNAVVAVTAHAFEPQFETTSISVQEITLQRTQGGDIVWATLMNTSAVPIRSYFVFVSAVGA